MTQWAFSPSVTSFPPQNLHQSTKSNTTHLQLTQTPQKQHPKRNQNPKSLPKKKSKGCKNWELHSNTGMFFLHTFFRKLADSSAAQQLLPIMVRIKPGTALEKRRKEVLSLVQKRKPNKHHFLLQSRNNHHQHPPRNHNNHNNHHNHQHPLRNHHNNNNKLHSKKFLKLKHITQVCIII